MLETPHLVCLLSEVGDPISDERVGTLISLTALYSLDKFGRRKTLLTGLVAMTTLWIMIGLLLKFYPADAVTATVPHGFIVAFIWIFYSTYVATWGPCGWWIPMEVLPTNLRAKGSALSVSFTFLYNLCVSKTTPLLFASIGYKTYFYYGGNVRPSQIACER